MSTTKVGHRVAAVVLASIFLVTSLGFSGLVIWEMSRENNTADNKTIEEITGLNNNQQSTTPKEGSMEGTQLADFTAVENIDSLQKIDTIVGEGKEAKEGNTVTVHYTGAVAATGVIFQSSHDSGEPIPFGLNQVIKGWTDGVPGMKVGGKRRLLIPADQAYGANPPAGSNIPANADLVFDIELVDVTE